jgi:hypothetical protein
MIRTFFATLFTVCLCLPGRVPAAGPLVLKTMSKSPFQFSVSPSTQTTVIEASTNMLQWVALATNQAGTVTNFFTDNQSVSFSRRFYRVRGQGATLGDLSVLTNSVFMANEGFDAIQFAPNGKLGFIVWRGQDLVYRERNGTVWSEQTIGTFGNIYLPGGVEEYRFQPMTILLFDSQSRAHILRLNGSSIMQHTEKADGTFAADTTISLSTVGSSFSLFAATMGAGDKLHVALEGSQSGAAITYGSNKGGSWQWSVVTNITGNPRGFFHQSYAPRWFSLAVDSQNFAHIAFCPEFALPTGPEGYLKPYCTLFYTSNKNGSWAMTKIADVADLSGDAGEGASIAIGPNDQPSIAAWYNERYPTGSSLYCLLNYYNRNADGTWNQQLLASTTAGYIAPDTDKGAGFAPYLRFDSQGRPNIAFLDDASQHFPTSGQNEYAGDLRHMYFDGTQWISRVIYAQNSPIDQQIVYPAMATLGNEVVFTGLERRTVWVQPDYRVATSTYTFFYRSFPLP